MSSSFPSDASERYARGPLEARRKCGSQQGLHLFVDSLREGSVKRREEKAPPHALIHSTLISTAACAFNGLLMGSKVFGAPHLSPVASVHYSPPPPPLRNKTEQRTGPHKKTVRCPDKTCKKTHKTTKISEKKEGKKSGRRRWTADHGQDDDNKKGAL
jgi:hypothetical protein